MIFMHTLLEGFYTFLSLSRIHFLFKDESNQLKLLIERGQTKCQKINKATNNNKESMRKMRKYWLLSKNVENENKSKKMISNLFIKFHT